MDYSAGRAVLTTGQGALSVANELDWTLEAAKAAPEGGSKPALEETDLHSKTRPFHSKRATDLMIPALETSTQKDFQMSQVGLDSLISELEGSRRTGCIKASSQRWRSRSLMLLYQGRAVGCIYGCREMPQTEPTEPSIKRMLRDLRFGDTHVTLYDLPDSIVLPMSALFLGYPVQRTDDYPARKYMNYICEWFQSKFQTACLAITLPERQATCLVFINKGRFAGAFDVEGQRYIADIDDVHKLLETEPQANIEASILPPEMSSPAMRYGYSLNLALN
jgi:hypothetical protein